MTAADEPDLAAAELALGVLEGEEHANALRRVLAEPAFAREVQDWRVRLAAFFAEWPGVEPGADVRRRALAIPDGEQSDRRGGWGWLAALSSAAAAALLVVVLTPPAPAPVVAPAVVRIVPVLVAGFKPASGDPFGAVFYPDAREVRLGGGVTVPAGRDAELWTIGGDGVPHAAGLLKASASRRLVLARELAIGTGTTLAISIEPVGGSPGPAPTGPVVATGTLTAI